MLRNNDCETLNADGTGCVKAQDSNDIKLMQKYTKNRK